MLFPRRASRCTRPGRHVMPDCARNGVHTFETDCAQEGKWPVATPRLSRAVTRHANVEALIFGLFEGNRMRAMRRGWGWGCRSMGHSWTESGQRRSQLKANPATRSDSKSGHSLIRNIRKKIWRDGVNNEFVGRAQQ